MMKRFLLLCFLFFSSLLCSNQPQFTFFQPPEGWLMSNPTHLEDGLKIGFVQSQRKIFTPAISLYIEKIPCDEKTYLNAVLKNHRSDITKSIRGLGLLQTKSGKSHLLQIDTKSNWGKIRILQSILVKEGYAYIQTATCLREDFLKINQELLKSFQSLCVADDLPSTLENHEELDKKLATLLTSWKKHLQTAKGEKEDLFKANFFQRNQWLPFTEYITHNYAEFGICWQILAIQYVKEQLMRMY
ncbi:hypothetical protein [Simkania negevensis]|uniref:Uncharacterized protein n=1 Tax=Simkania negevensis (strain ATCC VR-1471 / DSM 27360 / Z) TaxID=331113 RepID=F8L959_SIMNZ|nr:hypothetical protein [Simkania negevensis]CCB89374.1 putative uncharacterized protein [Simkania negevensis Z]